MVMKIPQLGLQGMCMPMKVKAGTFALSAFKMDRICMATTEMTSILIRLNSSKHPHEPLCTSPLKMRPTDL